MAISAYLICPTIPAQDNL